MSASWHNDADEKRGESIPSIERQFPAGCAYRKLSLM